MEVAGNIESHRLSKSEARYELKLIHCESGKQLVSVYINKNQLLLIFLNQIFRIRLGCTFIILNLAPSRERGKPSEIPYQDDAQDTVGLVMALICGVASIFACFAFVAICYRWCVNKDSCLMWLI